MRRFRFRLDTLLRMRVREEETAARMLEETRREISDCRERLQRAKRERLEYNERTCAESAEGLSGQRLLEKRAISEIIKQTIKATERYSVVLQEQVAKRETEWSVKRRARRVVENLRERSFRKWREDSEREEQKMIDEMASNRFNWRRRREGGVIGWVLFVILVAALGVGVWYGARLAGSRDIPLLSRPTGTLLSGPIGAKGAKGEASARVANATGEAGVLANSDDYSLTSGELSQTLEAIRQREEGLRQRTDELDGLEKRLQKRQLDVDAEVAKCEILRVTLEKQIVELKELKEWRQGEARDKKSAELARLTRLYEKTRPKEAAAMIAKLPVERAQDVLISMQEGQAIKVLSELSKTNPDLANEYLKSISDNMETVKKGSVR